MAGRLGKKNEQIAEVNRARHPESLSRRGFLRSFGSATAGAGVAVVLAATPAAADTPVAGSGGPAASDADVIHKGGGSSIEVITAAKDFNGPIRRGCGPEWDVTNGRWGLVPDLPGAAKANGAGLAALLAAAGPGDHLVFPNGELFVPAATIANNKAARALTFEGKGKLSSWLTPIGDLAGPLLDLAPPGPPSNGARGAYGGGVSDIGLNLSYAPSACGIHLGPWAAWTELHDLWIQGGATAIWNEGANVWMENLRLFDAARFFYINGDTGLELTIRGVQTARNAVGTTTKVLTVSASTKSAAGGALYVHDFRHSSGSAAGVQTNAGFLISSTGATNLSIPTFASKVVLDNIMGGGPGLEFFQVRDQHFSDGWVNCGTRTGGPSVRITGGGNLTFTGNNYCGGGSGTKTNKTYDFVGGATSGFISSANTCATNWVYYLPPTGGPSNMICDDYIPGGVEGMDMSNDGPQFAAASNTARFGSRHFSDKTVLAQPILPDGKASGFATLKAGTATIATPLAEPALSVIHKTYRSLVGVPGTLVVNNVVAGSNFTINSLTPSGTVNTQDNSVIEWIIVARG